MNYGTWASGGQGSSEFTAGWGEVWVVPGTRDWHPNRGQSCGTEPLTCGVCTNSEDFASEVNRLVGRPVGVGELVDVGRDSTFLVPGKKPRLTNPCALVGGVRLRDRGVMGVGNAPKVLLSAFLLVICILTISHRSQGFCYRGWFGIVSCPDLTTLIAM